MQIQIYDYFLEKRPKDFIEKNIIPVSHPIRVFIFTQDKTENSSWVVNGLLEEAIEWLLKKYEKKVKK